MGLAFNEEGDLFISDNQGWSGAEKAKNKGRVLRLKFENDQLKETITVASGLEHPNGIRIRDGKLYVTQSSLSQIKDPSGLLVSGVYCFDMNDRDIVVTNTSADKNLLTTVITKNPEVQYGLDGIVFNEAGDLFVGNFGDGAIHRIKMDAEGKVVSNDVWAQDTTQLRTTDGMCIDDKGNIWVADFSANAVARVDKNGKIERIAQSPDCDGSDGGLDQPGEPIVWNGQVIVSCFDLVTGPDIIFFWVARMIFSGMEQMKKEPFHTVFIHGLVRDSQGRKMSKSLGNGIDPLEMVDNYGADALRFNLITGNSPGNDMRFYVEKCEAMRNFCNKIWNASRFVMMNLSIDKNELPEKLELEDKWILSKLNTVVKEVCENMDSFELGVAAGKIYDFIWDSFCDWYIELTKPRLNGDNEELKLSAQKVLLYVLTEILKLLHPFMPFITEEIWQALPHEGEALMIERYPEYKAELDFPQDEQNFEMVMSAIKAVRARRSDMNVPPSRKAHLIIVTDKTEAFQAGRSYISKLAYASEVSVTSAAPEKTEGMVSVITDNARMFMPMAELVDLEKEKARIEKELANAEKQLAAQIGKLSNQNFVTRAPEAVVNVEREKKAKLEALIDNLKLSLENLGK